MFILTEIIFGCWFDIIDSISEKFVYKPVKFHITVTGGDNGRDKDLRQCTGKISRLLDTPCSVKQEMTGRRYIRSRKINLDNVGFFITDNGIWFSFIWNMLFPMDITVYNSIECRSFISRFTLKWNAVYRIKQTLLELRLNLFGAFLVFPRFIVDIPKLSTCSSARRYCSNLSSSDG